MRICRSSIRTFQATCSAPGSLSCCTRIEGCLFSRRVAMQHPVVTFCAARAVILAVLVTQVPTALAVPSFARQTGMACEACHTVYPELTHFGRVFKASGYVLDNLKQVRDVS